MAVKTKRDVLQLLRDHGDRLRSLGVDRIGLFGSMARDEARSDSDVDFLVQFDSGRKNFDNFMTLAFFLEELMGRRVELVTTEALSPYLGPRILDEVEYAPLSA